MIPRPNSIYSNTDHSNTGTSQPFLASSANHHDVVERQGGSKTSKCKCQTNCIVRGLESYFQWHGRFIGKHPVFVICLCFAFLLASFAGFPYYRKEERRIKLWSSDKTPSRLNHEFLHEYFPSDFRFANVIVEADNVLDPAAIQAMFQMRKKISEIKTNYGDTLRTKCAKMPVVKTPNFLSFIFGKRRKRRVADDFFTSDYESNFFSDSFEHEMEEEEDNSGFDKDDISYPERLSVEAYPEPYCNIVDSMEETCFESSVLELWGDNGEYESTEKRLESLSLIDILDTINNKNRSGIFLIKKNFTHMLGGITRDPITKEIVGAKATRMFWFLKMNIAEARKSPVEGQGVIVDKKTMEFEKEMLDILLNDTGLPEGLKISPHVSRSFFDIAGPTILGDVKILGIGYSIVFFYVLLMLGKFDWVGVRVYLAIAGIISVVFGIVFSIGICSAMGFFWSPMHSILPFLLLGIGIDDMFIIIQCWNTLNPYEKASSSVDKFGYTMRHAGVAITVTSLTDIVAFGIGGTSELPALRSFCIFSAVGIAAIYYFQVTFFVAWMVFDEKRISSGRNGCCPCIEVKKVKKNTEEIMEDMEVESLSIMSKIFRFYASHLKFKPVKFLIILITMGFTSLGAYGNYLIEQKFDPIWFIPPHTYLSDWFEANTKWFSDKGGFFVNVYVYEVDLSVDLMELERIIRAIESQSDIIDSVNSWTTNYIKYVDTHGLAEGTLYERITQFLHSPMGLQYKRNFLTVNGTADFDCGKSSTGFFNSNESIWYFNFNYKVLESDSKIKISAMNRIKDILNSANLTSSGRIFPLSQGYSMWETDEIIGYELYKNIIFAFVAVFIMTWIVISNFVASFLVLFAVMLTVLDVSGIMHFWGLTIDTVSCNFLIISIGLCVDYSTHVAHRFLIEAEGSRDQRIVKALTNIGPAVMNGGISTFLAFCLLCGSSSHVFITFFKVFFLVVTFGLFHGLVFLPVILSLIGPISYGSDTVDRSQSVIISDNKQDSINLVSPSKLKDSVDKE
uniref:SSD domain-containing protein n=1 Tax=Lepeophtheirus salmonis TaxID=72036 RepID=A0A0K2U8Y5_LEPSM